MLVCEPNTAKFLCVLADLKCLLVEFEHGCLLRRNYFLDGSVERFLAAEAELLEYFADKDDDGTAVHIVFVRNLGCVHIVYVYVRTLYLDVDHGAVDKDGSAGYYFVHEFLQGRTVHGDQYVGSGN